VSPAPFIGSFATKNLRLRNSSRDAGVQPARYHSVSCQACTQSAPLSRPLIKGRISAISPITVGFRPNLLRYPAMPASYSSGSVPS